jgi:hypothetical protein
MEPTGEARAEKNRVGEDQGGEGPGEGELDECIMHQVHTSFNKSHSENADTQHSMHKVRD